MPLTAATTNAAAACGGHLSPIVYSQIVHHGAQPPPPRSFASDYSIAGGHIQPPNGGGGGGYGQPPNEATSSGGAIPSSSTTMTSVTSNASYSTTDAEMINHPGSSLSLDVAPSEYLERSLVSTFRNVKYTQSCPISAIEIYNGGRIQRQLMLLSGSSLAPIIET
jgi:hypothetical protein